MQQFADGVTIDGTRIDALMGDWNALWNAIPKRMLQGRFTENRLVGGYMPHPTYVTDFFPFQPAHNSTGAVDIVSGKGPLAGAGVANEWRNKGFDVPGIDPKDQTDPVDETVLMWTNNLFFEKPKVLHGVFLTLGTDSVYLNDFLYDASPPPGKLLDDPVDDLFLEVAVKNAFLPGVRRLDDVVVHKVRFRLKSWLASVTNWSGVADTMLPPHPEGVPCRTSVGPGASPWICVDLRHLNIPLPSLSHVRFSIGIPLYDSYTSGWGNINPNSRQYYSWGLDVLEEIF